jgi:hypothetical protein
MFLGESLKFSAQALRQSVRSVLTAGHGDRRRLGDPGGDDLADQPRLSCSRFKGSAPISSLPITLPAGRLPSADADFVKASDVEAVRQQLGDRIVAATGVMTNYDRMVIGTREDIKVNGAISITRLCATWSSPRAVSSYQRHYAAHQGSPAHR